MNNFSAIVFNSETSEVASFVAPVGIECELLRRRSISRTAFQLLRSSFAVGNQSAFDRSSRSPLSCFGLALKRSGQSIRRRG